MTTPKEEFDAIRRRILEAERRLAEIRRAFLVDGKGTSQAVRAEIEYELADLRLRRHDCKRMLIELKEAATAFKRSNMLIVLIEKVKGVGRADLVDAASEEAMVALTDAGLLEDYQLSL